MQITSAASITVAAPDTVRNVHFPVSSPAFTIAGVAPTILSVTANANGAQGAGPQDGDQVTIIFDRSTNAPALAGAQLNAALPVGNSTTWLDGAGAVQSALWSTTTFANDTLTITLADTISGPTIAVGTTVATASLIADPSGTNLATGSVPITGTFGLDIVSVTTTDRAPATVTLGTTGATLLQLTLTADFNSALVTALRIDRIGTALDGDTIANGIKIYDDLDNDGVLDLGEPVLGTGTFAGGSVTITLAKVVAAGVPENLLVAVDTNPAGTPNNTLGVQIGDNSYLSLAADDLLQAGAFPAQSGVASLAAPGPLLLSAAAADQNGGAAGVQAGDTVTLVFSRTTNAFAVTAANINTVLSLNNAHTWLDGGGAIGSAAWSTTTLLNDTLTVTLSTTSGAPSVFPADAITIGAATIRDVTGTNNATGSPPTIGGAFGLDTLTLAFTNLAPGLVAQGASNVPFALATLTATPNPVLVTAIKLDRGGTSVDADVQTNGIKVWSDANGNGVFDIADSLLATASLTTGTLSFTTAITVTPGTPVPLIFTLSVAPTAVLLKTITLTQAAASYYTVATGDSVLGTNLPFTTSEPIIVTPPPGFTGGVATDTSGFGAGVQAGDQVLISFDSATNGFAITALNIDSVLGLNNAHSWRDGAAAIGSAVWSTTTNTNDTLTITLSAATSAPTVAPGDTITIAPGTIRDSTNNNDAIGSPPSLSGDFGADALLVTPTDLAPTVVNQDAGLVLMEALSFSALTNAVVVTSLRIDRLGTATDNDTPSGAVHIYHDLDGDKILDSGEPLLGSGAFNGGAVTIATPFVVNVGAPQRVLIGVTIQGAAGKTLGVALLNSSYVLVGAGDAVGSTNFSVLSTVTTIAELAPQLTGAIAADASNGGEGVHATDTVTLVFSGPTNAHPITAAVIDAVLLLSGSHTWLDGAGTIGSATWSTSTFANDTLTIVLSAATSAPTIATGDTITIGANTIMDLTSTNKAVGSPPAVTGSFGNDTLTVTGTSLAPAQIAPGVTAVPLLQLTAATTGNVALTGLTFSLPGTT